MSDITIKITACVSNGLKYLEEKCCIHTGFQPTLIGDTRGTLKPYYFPESTFDSMFALDLLGDHLSPETKYYLRNCISPKAPNLEFQYSVKPSEALPAFAGTMNFCRHNNVRVPDDTEDTSLYHYIALRDGFLKKQDHRVLDVARLMILNVDQHGCIRVYLPPMDKPREQLIDAASVANVLRFLYYYGIDHNLFSKTEDYVYDWLASKKYLEGTRYYGSPEAFLYFCAEAVSKSDRALDRFGKLLLDETVTRLSVLLSQEKEPEVPLDFAVCLLALECLDPPHCEKISKLVIQASEVLVKMSELSKNESSTFNGWPGDALYKLGRTSKFLGGTDLSAIFSVAALIRAKKMILKNEQ